MGLALVLDLDGSPAPGVEAQVHGQAAQDQVHFAELVAQADRAVPAYDTFQLREEDPIEIEGRIEAVDQVGGPVEAFVR